VCRRAEVSASYQLVAESAAPSLAERSKSSRQVDELKSGTADLLESSKYRPPGVRIDLVPAEMAQSYTGQNKPEESKADWKAKTGLGGEAQITSMFTHFDKEAENWVKQEA
jgi:hypothetical protein